MKVHVTVTQEELDEMELSEDSLWEEFIFRLDRADDNEMVGFEVVIETKV